MRARSFIDGDYRGRSTSRGRALVRWPRATSASSARAVRHRARGGAKVPHVCSVIAAHKQFDPLGRTVSASTRCGGEALDFRRHLPYLFHRRPSRVKRAGRGEYAEPTTLTGRTARGLGGEPRPARLPSTSETGVERRVSRIRPCALRRRASAGCFTDPRRRIPSTRSSGSCATRVISNERGEKVFEQQRRRGAQVLVADRDQRRGRASTSAASSARRSARRSVRQLIGRVADTIAALGPRRRLLRRPPRTAETFHAELTHILLNQNACFNSPVWFNVGIEAQPQCSACFINSVEDTMESILEPGQDRGHAVQVRLGHRLATSRRCAPRASRWPAAAPPPARSPS